jgi:hypothetical protein
MLSRETGHNRVPAPPHMITGMRSSALIDRRWLKTTLPSGPASKQLHQSVGQKGYPYQRNEEAKRYANDWPYTMKKRSHLL